MSHIAGNDFQFSRLLENTLQQLREAVVEFSVFGRYNSGKSTLINAILQDEYV